MAKIVPFSQMDPQWKNDLLGFDPELNIGKFGCLVTDMAMVAAGFGFEYTPASLNKKLKDLGANVGFSGGLVIPSSLPRAVPGMVYRDFMWCRDVAAPLARIDLALVQNFPVIVEVDYAPTDGLQSHWVVLYGKKNNDYLMQDPWPFPAPGGEVLLGESRFNFAGSLAKMITGVLWLENKPTPIVITPPPPGGIKVYNTVGDLALRRYPYITDNNLVQRLPVLTELASLESEADTRQKVGQLNQWLNVRLSNGEYGYVAAWYLSFTRSIPGVVPVPIGPPAPPPSGTPLSVFAAVNDLALRSMPMIASFTLVKRLPFGTELVVQETADAALPKVGVMDQWLKVKEISGDEGYVAAWYVTAQAPTPIGPGPTTPPAGSGDLIVRTTTDSLALRSQTVISDATLIVRLALGSELVALDPRDQALARVGVRDQWLRVRTQDGKEGYVAAWYVAARP